MQGIKLTDLGRVDHNLKSDRDGDHVVPNRDEDHVVPDSLHILVTSFFIFWLSRMTKSIFYVCLLTHFARQDRQNGTLKNKPNRATKVTKIRKNKVTKMT